MFKKLVFAAGVAVLVAGCSTSSSPAKQEAPVVVADEIGTTIFVDREGGIYTLNTTDLYETAKLTDSNGEIYNLKREPSANGVRLVKGSTEVFFDNEVVFLTIDGKEIPANIKK